MIDSLSNSLHRVPKKKVPASHKNASLVQKYLDTRQTTFGDFFMGRCNVFLGTPDTYSCIHIFCLGWRASEPGCNLERFGVYAKPRGCAVKNFGWPHEGLD